MTAGTQRWELGDRRATGRELRTVGVHGRQGIIVGGFATEKSPYFGLRVGWP